MNLTVKTVTQANLAEVVAEKRASGANISSHEDIARMALPAEKPAEVKPEGVTERAEGTPPEPNAENPYKAKAEKEDDKENPFAKRIKELTREKRELEEFAEGEYNTRLTLQKRLTEIESQKPEPKVEADPEPDPTKYTDQKDFLKDWGTWQRKTAVKEFQAAEQERLRQEEAARLTAELNERSQLAVAAARKDHEDFDEVIARSPYKWDQLPVHFRATLMESDNGGHILYELFKDPEETKRVLAMRPGAMALELGRRDSKFSKKPAEKAEKAAPVVNQTRAPAPMPSLNGTGEVAQNWDPGKPQPFNEYKRRKLDENRRKARH